MATYGTNQCLAEGTLLNDGMYRIDAVLGQGSDGITYLATDLMLNCQVAIKEFFPAYIVRRDGNSDNVVPYDTNPDAFSVKKAKFMKAVHDVAKLSHPNIVLVRNGFSQNNTSYCVMSYVQGLTLQDAVDRFGPISPDRAVRIISGISRALGYMHSRKVSHRDVKPSNLMVLVSDDTPYVIDFGLSIFHDELASTSVDFDNGVSHGYSPIECYHAQMRERFIPESDIYSLGATLYFILTAKVPPHACSLLQEDLTFPPDFPVSFQTVVKKALAPRLSDRYRTMAEFEHDLQSALLKQNHQTPSPSEFAKKSVWTKAKQVIFDDLLHSSYVLGMLDGKLFSVHYTLWYKLSKSVKDSFEAKYLFIDSRHLGLSAKYNGKFLGIARYSCQVADGMEAMTRCREFNEKLNPAGVVGSELGKAWIPNREEMECLENYHDELEKVFSEWNFGHMSEYFWVDYGDRCLPNSNEAACSPDLKVDLRLLVDYQATTQIFMREDIYRYDSLRYPQLDGVQVLTCTFEDNILRVILHIDRNIFETMQLRISPTGDRESILRLIGEARVIYHPADDETPDEYFWNNLSPRGSITFLLHKNEAELIHSYKLSRTQYIHAAKNLYVAGCHALGYMCSEKHLMQKVLSPDDFTEIKLPYFEDVVTCEVGDGIVEIQSIDRETMITGRSFSSDYLLKGAAIQSLVLFGRLQDLMFMDIIGYDVSLLLLSNGRVRKSFPLFKASDHFPIRKDVDIPEDLLTGSQLYLQIGARRLDVNFMPTVSRLVANGVARVSVELNPDKTIIVAGERVSDHLGVGDWL